MNKLVSNADEAVRDIFDGATIMVGGFGLCGVPENLLRALVRKGVKDLTTVSNNVGIDGFAMGWLLQNGQIQSHIGSYVGENKLLEQMVLEKKLICSSYRREHPRNGSGRAAQASQHSLPRRASEQ